VPTALFAGKIAENLEKNCTLFQKNRLSDLKKTKSAIMLSCGLWLFAEKVCSDMQQ
jgi:hypothetical protein